MDQFSGSIMDQSYLYNTKTYKEYLNLNYSTAHYIMQGHFLQALDNFSH